MNSINKQTNKQKQKQTNKQTNKQTKTNKSAFMYGCVYEDTRMCGSMEGMRVCVLREICTFYIWCYYLS